VDDEPKFKIGEDGEVDFEALERKPKRKRKPLFLRWQTVQVSLPLLLIFSVVTLCSAAMLLVYITGNQGLICQLTLSCPQFSPADDYDYMATQRAYSPSLPLNTSRINSRAETDGTTTITTYTTVTPAVYLDPNCSISELMTGSKLMFVSGEGDNAEIFVANEDGSERCRLTHNLIEERFIEWSPDRRHILFVSYRADQTGQDVFLMNTDGSNVVNLTNDQAIDVSPIWSPDGSRIAFISMSDGSANLHIMNADGSGRQNLNTIPSTANDGSPSWSPDGQRLVFTSEREGNPNNHEIYTIDLNGQNLQRLTTNGVMDYNSVWSPDGRWIAYYAEQRTSDGIHQGTDVFIMESDGSNRRQLTFGQGTEHDLTWSLDSTSLAFIAHGDVYTVETDGGLQPRLVVPDDISSWGLTRSDCEC